MRRKSAEQFKKEVELASPNVELLEEYKKMAAPVKCRCQKCGYQWYGNPAVLIRKGANGLKKSGGCPECAGVRKKTHAEFLEEFYAKYTEFEVLSIYQGANEPVLCKCKKCGHEWYITPHTLLSGRKSVCPMEAKNRQRTPEEFREQMEKINPKIEILDNFVNMKTPLTCCCKECGNKWALLPQSLFEGSGCPKCKDKKLREERSMGQKEFERRLSECNPQIEVLGKYINTASRIQVQCKKCGRNWSPYASNLLSGYGCAKCAGNKKISKSEFMKAMKKFPEIEVVGEFAGGSKKITVRCNSCGRIWDAEPGYLMRSRGCRCRRNTHTSSQEEFVAAAFEQFYGKSAIKRHDKDTIGRELDILIKKHDLAIEVGDWNYHEENFEDDMLEQELCERKGIRLIVLYFNVINQENMTQRTDMILMKSGLKRQEDKQAAAEKIAELADVDMSFSPVIWDQINVTSAKRARRKTEDEFEKELKEMQPDFELMSEYINSYIKIHVRCKRCGHDWWGYPYNIKKPKRCPGEYTRQHPKMTKEVFAEETYRCPQSILKGNECRRCAERRKKTQEQFVNEMEQINPNIQIMAEYDGATAPVASRCLFCGWEWKATPDSLLHGHGCPECAGNRKRTQAEFENAVRKINPQIRCTGKYRTRKSKIKCQCIVCGARFERWVDSLYKRCRCPECRI